MENNYYDTLGVDENANAREIKKAYRVKAREYHPDVNQTPGAGELFKIIQEAYDVLSDEEQKDEYDTRIQHSSSDSDSEYTTLDDNEIDTLRREAYERAVKRAKLGVVLSQIKRLLRHILIFTFVIYLPIVAVRDGALAVAGYVLIVFLVLALAQYIYIGLNIGALFLIVTGFSSGPSERIWIGVAGVIVVNAVMLILGWLITDEEKHNLEGWLGRLD